MLTKYIFILLLKTFLIFNSPVKAEVYNYIVGDNEYDTTQRIDSFFIKHPNEKRVFWLPEIKGKSRYAFSIPKDAYLISKKYSDASDLYYLTEKIDDRLKFHKNKSKNIEIFISKNKSKVILKQMFLSNINAGLFLEKEKNHFGMILNKDFIFSKSDLGNIGFELDKDGHKTFRTSFAKLARNDNSELYGNISYEFKSKNIKVDTGYTWFEIADQLDFTLNMRHDNKRIMSDIFASFGEENMIFQIGLREIKNIHNTNIFFNLMLEDILYKKYFNSKINIRLRNDIINDNNLSLKSFRKHKLDSLWEKYIKF